MLNVTTQDSGDLDDEELDEEEEDGSENDDEGLEESGGSDGDLDRKPADQEADTGSRDQETQSHDEKSDQDIAERTRGLSLEDSNVQPHPSANPDRVREVVAAQVSKSRARDKSKYHSRKNPIQAGRAKGSKAKQDIRQKMDTSGIWG